jgi:hypothetical protein
MRVGIGAKATQLAHTRMQGVPNRRWADSGFSEPRPSMHRRRKQRHANHARNETRTTRTTWPQPATIALQLGTRKEKTILRFTKGFLRIRNRRVREYSTVSGAPTRLVGGVYSHVVPRVHSSAPPILRRHGSSHLRAIPPALRLTILFSAPTEAQQRVSVGAVLLAVAPEPVAAVHPGRVSRPIFRNAARRPYAQHGEAPQARLRCWHRPSRVRVARHVCHAPGRADDADIAAPSLAP